MSEVKWKTTSWQFNTGSPLWGFVDLIREGVYEATVSDGLFLRRTLAERRFENLDKAKGYCERVCRIWKAIHASAEREREALNPTPKQQHIV